MRDFKNRNIYFMNTKIFKLPRVKNYNIKFKNIYWINIWTVHTEPNSPQAK